MIDGSAYAMIAAAGQASPAPDFKALLQSITLADMAYEPDDATARAAFAARGYTVLDRYSDDEAQALALLAPDGRQILDITGTRASEGALAARAVDVGEDIVEVFPPDQIGVDAKIASGAHLRATRVWGKLGPLFDTGRPMMGIGHSLGGDTVHALPGIAGVDRFQWLHAWEPPKVANDAYFQMCGWPNDNFLTVINGFDWWADYPWPIINFQKLKHPPGPILWLSNGGWEWVTRETWPGGQLLHASDHDSSLISGIVAKLAATPQS